MRVVFVLYNDGFLTPGTLGTSALIDTFARLVECEVVVVTPTPKSAPSLEIDSSVRIIYSRDAIEKDVFRALRETPQCSTILYILGLKGARLAPMVKGAFPQVTKIVVDIRAPQVDYKSLRAKQIRSELFDAVASIDQVFFCDSKQLYLNYRGLDCYVPVDELPFGLTHVHLAAKTEAGKNVEPYLCFVGSLSRKRDMEWLLDAVDSFLLEAIGLKLKIVGGGDHEYIEMLKHQYSSASIEFLGEMSLSGALGVIRSARGCIAYVPQTLPLSLMPSLKLMEYVYLNDTVLAVKTLGHLKQARGYNIEDQINWFQSKAELKSLLLGMSSAQGVKSINDDIARIPWYDSLVRKIAKNLELTLKK